MNSQSIQYGEHAIDFYLLYDAAKTLRIEVHPDGAVIAKAPQGTAIEEIKERVRRRGRWIRRQQAFFQQFEPRTPPRLYVGGETHLYLGRQYRLKIVRTDEPGVKLQRGYFFVRLQGAPNSLEVQRLLERWYAEKAERRFREAFDRCWASFSELKRPVLTIRKMKRRWGSLSGNGRLTLNVDLVRAPRECIDYVITHELCHLVHPDHSVAFYQLLELHMPDWQQRKHKLELALV